MLARLAAPLLLVLLPSVGFAQDLTTSLAEVVADTCDAQIVFLGEEGSHGGGRSIEVRTEIVRELIRRCDFTHVAFESQIYDFIDLQERYAAGTGTREALYDAIGGLWSRAKEIDGLVELLHDKARVGELSLSGFDGNFGGATALFTQTRLPQRLARILPATRGQQCEAFIARLTSWKFDGATPKDATFDDTVLGCAKEIERLAAQEMREDPVLHRLARSFRASLESSQPDDRDRLMHENLDWTISRLPRGTKTIVWTANVHAMRQARNGFVPVASLFSGDGRGRMRSLAVIGAAGTYAAPDGWLTEIVSADADSLEGRFVPRDGAAHTYVDSDSLKRLGTVKSRVRSYGRYVEDNWGDLFDGVLVLAAETPQSRTRPARPMQATTAAATAPLRED